MPETNARTSPPSENNGAVSTPHPSQPQVNVYAVLGADPEVQAYAMAKYSRSALSMKESLREINGQKAEQFLNTFYFQYGHRSIADLAHIAFAIEKLSILAAILLADEQRWDGQERSTRYQNFSKSGYHLPDFGGNNTLRTGYCETVDFLFAEYAAISEEMRGHYTRRIPCPPEMAEDAYGRALRARAFDQARYLLPLAANTSLGQIVSARTLETQISRLLSSPYPEARHLGEALKQAAAAPGFNVQGEALQCLVEEIKSLDPALGSRAEQQLLRSAKVAPTLVKHARPNNYEIRSRQELAQAAKEIMADAPTQPAPLVDLVEDDPLEIEIASTLLYSACHYSYRQVRERVRSLSAAQRAEIADLGLRHRGTHDELPRAFHAGGRFIFDILMDVGGFRDMHRHRRCTQIEQGFTSRHGYETPPGLAEAGLEARYHAAMRRALETHLDLNSQASAADAGAAIYVLPLAFRKRALFKMDFAEAVYIAELRTGPTGHFSYRNAAYAMYEEVAKKHPSLAQYFRVTNIHEPVDPLKR